MGNYLPVLKIPQEAHDVILIRVSPVCSGYSQCFGVHLNDVLEFLSILFCIIGKQFYCTSLLLLLLLLFLIYCFCNVLFLVVFFYFTQLLNHVIGT